MDPRFFIRTARPESDGAALARIYGVYVRDTVISFEETAPSPEEMSQRARDLLPAYPYLVCEAKGQVVGFAYAGPHNPRTAYRWSVNVSVYLAPDVRRRGIGRALYERLFEILRRQGFHQAFGGITLPNDNSVGLHEAMGFSLVGVYPEVGFKFGAWHDVGWWRLLLAAGCAPAEPIPFAELDAGEAASTLS